MEEGEVTLGVVLMGVPSLFYNSARHSVDELMGIVSAIKKALQHIFFQTS